MGVNVTVGTYAAVATDLRPFETELRRYETAAGDETGAEGRGPERETCASGLLTGVAGTLSPKH
jgi:hypothetical protein